jgi:hypothetical protein
MVRGCPLLGVLLLLGLLLGALAQPQAHARSPVSDGCAPAPCYWDRTHTPLGAYCRQIPVPLDVVVVPYGEPVRSGVEGVTVVEVLGTPVFTVVPVDGLSTPGG